MYISTNLETKYNEFTKTLEVVQKQVSDRIIHYCRENDFLFKDRIKDVESVADKIETGRYSSFIKINDLYACTIVINSRLDELRVLEYLKEEFEFIYSRSKEDTESSPNEFSYNHTRVYCKLKNYEQQEDIIFQVEFEIQIKTILEYAWTVAVHDKVYKNERIDWKRERLSSQLMANIEQIDNVILNFEELSSSVVASQYKETQIKIDILDTINGLLGSNSIEENITSSNVKRVVENFYTIMKINGILKDYQDYMGKFIEYCKHDVSEDAKPISISIVQYFILFLSSLIELKDSDKYFYNITDELTTFDNKFKRLINRFKY